MNQKKRITRVLQIVEFHAEAFRLAGKVSANQRHFLEVAATHGRKLEQSGLLAGGKS
ncbi:hypothetical protein [Pseudomonas fluorescens]|uniref:hypothetical protein n=1 Tax=Pseudomonas fluorescens TaxID=294 RepID=UPI00177AEBC6|nr:hypothetical protein [Pseudomonas fluorescens]